MPGFRILRLPEVAQMHVLRHSELVDLLTLSYCSQKLNNLVILANVPVNQCIFFYFSDDEGMTIRTDGGFSAIKVERPIVDDEMKTVVLSSRPEIQRTLFRSHESVEVIEDLLVQHLLNTFRRIDNIQVNLRQDDILNNVLFKHQKTVKEVDVERTRPLTGEEVKFVLEDLTVDRDTTIRTPVVNGFQYSEGLKSQGDHIYHADWIQMDAVLNSTSIRIFLHERQQLFPTAQLNNFLKTWISKEKMEELSVFTIFLNNHFQLTDRFWTEVLDGIDYEQIFPESVKMLRIDGKVAQLTITRRCFDFSAWHE